MENLFPAGFLASLEDCPGFDRKAFAEAHRRPPVISVRMNQRKPFASFAGHRSVHWCDDGYYLDERPSFTLDPLFHAGCYYVQEASGMFLHHVMKTIVTENRGYKFLDLCAAPGGKSTLLAGWMKENDFLVSNEVIRSRVSALSENMIKWGNENVIVTNNDAKDFSPLKNYFDVIVIDAPCSGSGLFRKDPGAMKEWSIESVDLCSRRQKRIMEDIIPSLRQDGFLIYCTCSYSKKENEDIADFISENYPVENISILVPAEWGIAQSVSDKKNAGYRFYPDKTEGEGFYLTVFQKKSEKGNPASKENIFEEISGEEKNILSKWTKANDLKFFRLRNEVFCVTAFLAAEFQFLSHLKIIQSGIACGKILKNDLQPDHALAMSHLLRDEIPNLTVNKEEALSYLRKDNFDIRVAKGWNLVKYNDANLGWIKVLENRINNYYPVEWRIRK